MKKEVMLFTLILIFSSVLTITILNASAQPIIKEVMPHINNSWNDEWLEIYNPTNETLNLSFWKIGDRLSNDTFSLIIYPYDFALIVDTSTNKDNKTGCRAFNISNESCINLTTIGSGLNDDNETLYLYNSSNNSIDLFSWSTSIKSTGNSWGKYNNSWLTCTPTPGSENNCPSQEQEEENQTPDTPENNYDDEEQESSIDIKDYPDQAKFGDKITIDVKVYRGNTGKYAVYAYVQDTDDNRVSDKKTIHIDDKYDTYREDIKLTLKCLNESGTYKIVVEGLNERDTQSIDLKSCFGTEDDSQIGTIETNEVESPKIPETYTPPIALTGQATASTPQTTLKSSSLSFLDMLPYALLAIIAILVIYFIIKR